MPAQTSRWTILLAGDLRATPRLIGQTAGTRAIAADGGIRHARALGLTPELWIGDFDSASPRLLNAYAYANVPRRAHPADKDATDGNLAMDEAIRRGARHVVLAGALGGRMDHATAILAHMTALAAGGLSIMATSGKEEAWPLVPGGHVISLPAGTTFSIIGFTALRGIALKGAKWPLRKADIPFGSTLGVSNIAREDLQISLEEGRGVLLAQIAGD